MMDQPLPCPAGLTGAVLPGILLASLFPAIIGSRFPGAVYASQSLAFRQPAQVGVQCATPAALSMSSSISTCTRTRSWTRTSSSARQTLFRQQLVAVSRHDHHMTEQPA
jgi:hypothetical protein